MEVLSVLIVLFIGYCIDQYFDLSAKGPWKLERPPQKWPAPLEPVKKELLPVKVLEPALQPSEIKKEILPVASKALCRKCAYLDRGECMRGISGAPHVHTCAVYVKRKSKAGRQVLKELKELEGHMASCEADHSGDSKGLESPSKKGVDRSEIILFDMEKL